VKPELSIDGLQTPALLVRLDRVRANLATMRARLAEHGGLERWRPHVKTAKTPSVLKLLLEIGLTRFKCATTREAAVMLECADETGVAIDLCVALTHRGRNLERVAELARRAPHHRLSVLTEDPEHARHVRELAPELGLFLDLDPRFGRSGIGLDDDARLDATLRAAGDAFMGLHAYEGQIRDARFEDRTRACAPLFARLVEIVRTRSLERFQLVTSGTPTFEQALAFEPFRALNHRVSPGIVVYWDTNSASLGIDGFECAATVLARVVSAVAPGRVTLDAGSKSLDAAAGDPCVRVRGWPQLVAQHPSEEHTPLVALDGRAPPVGTLLELEPRHVCPMVNLADDVALLEGERVVRLERVAARGHDLGSVSAG
jgi:D-serine deaminase-like pyridoxal phosphate-dependent protein